MAAALIAPMPVWAMPQSDAPAPVPAPVFAVPSVEDLTLLKKAIDAVQQNPLALTSDLQVKAVANGVVMTITETVQTTGQFGKNAGGTLITPGMFRSDVVLLDEDGRTPAAKFQVISDGRTVTTYRAGTKQYATQDMEAFRKNNAVPTLGIVAGLIAAGDPWGGDPPADDAGVAAFLGILKGGGLILESGAGQNGQRLFLLRAVDEKTNPFNVQMTIEPGSASFVQMQMKTRADAWKITITENVRSMAKMPAVTLAPFAPPADAKKIEKLSVLPF